jgi:hypothetical protein
MKTIIISSIFVLVFNALFAQSSKVPLNGYVYAHDGALYENVLIQVYRADGTLWQEVIVDSNGKYNLELITATDNIFNIYSNEQLIHSSKILLVGSSEITHDFVIPFPIKQLEGVKSVMSTPKNIQATHIDRLATNNIPNALATRPGYFINKEGDGIRIAAPATNQPVYMIDGMRINGNSSDVRLPKGSVGSIDIK